MLAHSALDFLKGLQYSHHGICQLRQCELLADTSKNVSNDTCLTYGQAATYHIRGPPLKGIYDQDFGVQLSLPKTLAMTHVSHTSKMLLTIVLARISYDPGSHLRWGDRYLRGAA